MIMTLRELFETLVTKIRLALVLLAPPRDRSGADDDQRDHALDISVMRGPFF